MTLTSNVLEGFNSAPFAVDLYSNGSLNHDCVIYVHGFNGFKDWGNFSLIAKEFLKSNIDVVSFNFSHNGTSLQHPEDFVDLERYGNNNYTAELTDLGKVIDYVNGLKRYKKIVLLGHSRGGGISILKANEDARINLLITWASVAACKTPWASWSQARLDEWKEKGVQFYENKRTNQQMPLYYQLYLDYINNQERLDVVRAMSNLKIPILIQHGTEDEAVSYQHAELLHKSNAKSKLLLYSTNHTFGRSHPHSVNVLPQMCLQAIEDAIIFIKQ